MALFKNIKQKNMLNLSVGKWGSVPIQPDGASQSQTEDACSQTEETCTQTEETCTQTEASWRQTEASWSQTEASRMGPLAAKPRPLGVSWCRFRALLSGVQIATPGVQVPGSSRSTIFLLVPRVALRWLGYMHRGRAPILRHCLCQ